DVVAAIRALPHRGHHAGGVNGDLSRGSILPAGRQTLCSSPAFTEGALCGRPEGYGGSGDEGEKTKDHFFTINGLLRQAK
ncbi:MAG: hypothetical protein ACPHQB_08485, partial [Miltoncostaeaceae bacterium]